jgi:predicted amidohydrolase
MPLLRFLSAAAWLLLVPVLVFGVEPRDWTSHAPRDEIAPNFSMGPDSKDAVLIIESSDSVGTQGWWSRSFPVTGGEYVEIKAHYRVVSPAGVDESALRRAVFVKLHWRDEAGKKVVQDSDLITSELQSFTAYAEAEHPPTRGTVGGVTEISGVYRVPSKATEAIVQLHTQWVPKLTVEWSRVSLTKTEEPAPRKVRLAAIHYLPNGKTADENCRQFSPLIEDAAKQKADLVVLGEVVNGVGAGPYDQSAEPIPGPSTNYFAELAKQHKLHLVVGLFERDESLVYNVAVLLGPDGQILGKYRKVTLPREEIEQGVTPGTEYPVFDTALGKVGMMVCYDGFFPEPARELAANGAEIIAWPVWGCNPLLAAARACENHVYVVSSTYCDRSLNWMVSAVFDHAGHQIATAEKFGTVAVAEVDLSRPTRWPSLGEFKAMIPRHKPLSRNAIR